MKMLLRVRVIACAALLVSAALAQTTGQTGADIPSQHVELYFQTSRTVKIEGITAAVALEESICQVQVADGSVQITGVNRGQSAVLLWAGEQRINLLVDVIDRPAAPAPATLYNVNDYGVRGVLSTNASVSVTPGGISTFLTTNVDWAERLSPSTQLELGGTFLDEITAGGRTLNVARASIVYRSPTLQVRASDFALRLRGETLSYYPGADPAPSVVLRGGDLRWTRGTTSYEFFAGTTVPAYFLSLSKTGRVAGVVAEHRFTNALRTYSTTFYSSSTNPFDLTGGRQQSVTNLSGIDWQLRPALSLSGNTGVSTEGSSGSASVDYNGASLSAFATIRHSDSTIPLRSLRAISDVGTVVSTGAGFAINTRLHLYGFFDRRFAGSDQLPANIEKFSAASSYGGHATLKISEKHTGSLVYTTTSAMTSNGFTAGAVHRFESTVMSTLTNSLQNTADVGLNRYEAGNGLDQHSDWVLQDSTRWWVRPTVAIVGGLSYGRTELSLASLIRQQLSLLSPDQVAAFERDPVAFLNSPDLPPALRALFDSLQPSRTVITAGLDWAHGRLRVAPTMRVGINTGASQQRSYELGYTASYQLSRGTFLQSTLSHQYYVTPTTAQNLNRTTQISIGLVKDFNRNPTRWLSQKVQGNQISGRVFIDRSLRGVYQEEAEGLAGIRVVLDDGRSTLTNAQGEFEFSRLTDRLYRVRVPLDQFATPVRLTSASPASVDLRNRRTAVVDFGIVNFAQVVVLAFNDYLMNGNRQADAPLIPGLKLHLIDAKGRHRMMLATGGGDYEASKIEPGTYELQVAADSVPTGYALPTDRVRITVEPASSSVVNLAFRAMRSISGKVQFRSTTREGESQLRPLAGVQVAVGDQRVTTGPDGTFLVRDLPAGEIPIRVVCCLGEIPANITLPSGVIRLNREPQQLDNINITINNPELLTYIAPTLAPRR